MPDKDDELIAFLLSGSHRDVQDAMLTHLTEERNRFKELRECLESWMEEAVQARMLAWFNAHGEELAARLNAPSPPKPETLSPQPFRLPSARNICNRKTWRKLR